MPISRVHRTRRLSSMIPLIAGVTLLASATVSVAESVTLRYAHFGPNRGDSGAAVTWLKDEIEKRSNGEIVLDVHWGGSLAAAPDVPRVVGAGLADIGSIVSSYTPGLLDLYEAGNQLVGPDNLWVAQQAIYELATQNEDVRKQFEDNNVVYIANLNAGFVQLICREPLTALDQMKDLKIRTGGPYTDVFRRMGAATIAMPQPDVYQALDTGVVDCNQNYHLTIDAFRQYEVAKHVIELDFGLVMAYGVIMNKDVWDDLGEEKQMLIRGVADDFNEFVVKYHLDAVEEVKKRLSSDKPEFQVTYSKPPAGMLDEIKKHGADLAKEWAASVNEKGLPADTVFADYQRLMEKHQAEFDSKGYPWE
jgi:TRAP-type transport system periplasmic protein